MDLVLLATEAAETTGGGMATLLSLLPLVLMFVVMYFIMIRPQRKKQKEEEKMRNNIQIGDEILTIGGFYGRVVSLKEDALVIESASDHSKQKIARWAVQQNLTIHDN
ncbi:MAG: preprotein translocase subunit YajC [Clostridia bacterium]|nr:preprotein translocase subunit YajC [Clostridia bacterium]